MGGAGVKHDLDIAAWARLFSTNRAQRLGDNFFVGVALQNLHRGIGKITVIENPLESARRIEGESGAKSRLRPTHCRAGRVGRQLRHAG